MYIHIITTLLTYQPSKPRPTAKHLQGFTLIPRQRFFGILGALQPGELRSSVGEGVVSWKFWCRKKSTMCCCASRRKSWCDLQVNFFVLVKNLQRGKKTSLCVANYRNDFLKRTVLSEFTYPSVNSPNNHQNPDFFQMHSAEIPKGHPHGENFSQRLALVEVSVVVRPWWFRVGICPLKATSKKTAQKLSCFTWFSRFEHVWSSTTFTQVGMYKYQLDLQENKNKKKRLWFIGWFAVYCFQGSRFPESIHVHYMEPQTSQPAPSWWHPSYHKRLSLIAFPVVLTWRGGVMKGLKLKTIGNFCRFQDVCPKSKTNKRFLQIWQIPYSTLQENKIARFENLSKMTFLFPRWDMRASGRVDVKITHTHCWGAHLC